MTEYYNDYNQTRTQSDFYSAYTQFTQNLKEDIYSLVKGDIVASLINKIERIIHSIFSYPELSNSPKKLFNDELATYRTRLIEERKKDGGSPKFTHFNKRNSLESNLELAQKILDSTKKTVLFSANYIARNRDIIDEKAAQEGIVLEDLSPIVNEAIKQLNTGIRDIDSEFKIRNFSHFAKINIQNQKTRNVLIGNCGQLADVALFIGMEEGAWNVHLDKVYIKNGDHAFLMIGREPGSNPLDYKTWGPNAVAVDAWAGNFFKLCDIEKNLNDYCGMEYTTGKPRLRPFNPKTQSIVIEIGNIISTFELTDFKKECHLNEPAASTFDLAIEQLKIFNEASDLKVKLEVAEKLSELCTHPHIQHLWKIASLKDQLDHFKKLGSEATKINAKIL